MVIICEYQPPINLINYSKCFSVICCIPWYDAGSEDAKKAQCRRGEGGGDRQDGRKDKKNASSTCTHLQSS